MAHGKRQTTPSHGEEESQAACGGRKTSPEALMGRLLLSHKALGDEDLVETFP